MNPTAHNKQKPETAPAQLPLLKDYVVVVLLWLCFQAAWFFSLGVHFDLEAGKYISEAQNLLQHGTFSAGRFLFYSTTIVVIAFCFATKLGLYGALLAIMAFNLFSYLYVYKALRFFFQNRIAPLFVLLCLLSFWPYQSWTLYLYTESLFYSFVALHFAHLLLFQKATTRWVIGSVLLLFAVVLSRPLGILFIPPTLLFYLFKISRRQRTVVFIAVVLAAIMLNYVIQVVFTTTSDWNMQRAITEGDIICDIPGTPADHLVLTNHPNQLYRLWFYITHNMAHFSQLALTRLRYFFTMVRPYYSVFHNIFLLLYLLFWYGSILVGIRRIIRRFSLPLLLFMGSTIVLFAAAIALQCDDYHNRFFLTLTPFWAIMAAVVWMPALRRLKLFSSRHKD